MTLCLFYKHTFRAAAHRDLLVQGVQTCGKGRKIAHLAAAL